MLVPSGGRGGGKTGVKTGQESRSIRPGCRSYHDNHGTIRRNAVATWCCNRNGVHVAGNAPQEIDAIIQKSDDWRGATLSRLRGIVLDAGPAVVEEVKWKKPSRPEGVPVWSFDGIVCIGEMLKNAVRLTFPKGAQMQDPKQLFNARLNSTSVRAIDFFEGEKVPEAALRALIAEAVGLNV
jgi:hypothetical protein